MLTFLKELPESVGIPNYCIRNFLANVLLCAHKKTRTLNKVLVNDFGLIITCDNLNIPQFKKQRARKGTFVQKYRKTPRNTDFPAFFFYPFSTSAIDNLQK